MECDLSYQTVGLLLPSLPAGSLVHAGYGSIHVSPWFIREFKGNLGWEETPSRSPFLAPAAGASRDIRGPGYGIRSPSPYTQAISCQGPRPSSSLRKPAWPSWTLTPHRPSPSPGPVLGLSQLLWLNVNGTRILGADLSLLGWLVPLNQGLHTRHWA